MSPRGSRQPLPPGVGRPDPGGQTWQTPAPEPVPAPDADVALAVRGSRRALWRFARGALIRWAISGLPLAGIVLAEFADVPVSAKVFCGLCAVALAWSPVSRTVAVLRATRVMATRPWRLYRTSALPAVGTVRLEVWQAADKQATRGYLKVTASGVSGEELSGPTYREVWLAGDAARGGVLVPSGGGDLAWTRPTRGPQPSRARATRPAKPARPRSPKALARELARKEKARERAAKARARAAARAEKARQRAKDKPPPPVRIPKPRQPRTPRRGRGIGKGLPFQ